MDWTGAKQSLEKGMAVSISLGEIGPIISYYVRIIASALSLSLAGLSLSRKHTVFPSEWGFPSQFSSVSGATSVHV